MNQLNDNVKCDVQKMEECDHFLFPVKNWMAPEESFDTVAYYCPLCGLTNRWDIDPSLRVVRNEIFEKQALAGKLNNKTVTTSFISEEDMKAVLLQIANETFSSDDEMRARIRSLVDQLVEEKVLQKKK